MVSDFVASGLVAPPPHRVATAGEVGRRRAVVVDLPLLGAHREPLAIGEDVCAVGEETTTQRRCRSISMLPWNTPRP